MTGYANHNRLTIREYEENRHDDPTSSMLIGLIVLAIILLLLVGRSLLGGPAPSRSTPDRTSLTKIGVE